MGVVQAKVKGFILLIQNDFLPLFEGSRRPSVQPCKSPDPGPAAERFFPFRQAALMAPLEQTKGDPPDAFDAIVGKRHCDLVTFRS
jgi:hypothetical protein